MYAILAEDKSDVATLKNIVIQLSRKKNIPAFRTKGYSGCGELLKKGGRDLKLFAEDCHRFIVCYDSDREDPVARRNRVMDKVVRPAKLDAPICVLVPVQEIEAWILADLQALGKVIPTWRGHDAEFHHPETIPDPKEYLTNLTRRRGRPLYTNAVHNPKIAEHLNLAIVERKCPSFKPLVELVLDGKGNV